jgi:DNA polymerase III alpha subunit
MWQNYHKHSDISNTRITDSVVKNEAYAKRAVELGQQIISSCEHGSAGDYRGCYELAKKYDLKWRYVAEVYFVIDRHEKDQTNAHMILAARTEKGIGDLNEVISEVNLTGFYGRPRVDMELLMTLNPKDVFVTTACLAGIWSYGKHVTEDGQIRYDFTLPDRLVGQLRGHFGDSFMLEVQYHNTPVQKIINQHILQLYRNQGIPVIFGCDSHYIYPEEKAARDARLAANKIQYDDEDGWYMDYPDEDTVIQRFTDQGVLPLPIVREALDNTNVFLQFEDVEFDFSKKVPTIYPQLSQEERNQKFTELIRSLWLERRPSIPRDRWDEYQEGIKYELIPSISRY